MWALYCQTRGGFGSTGHLPEAGGVMDQHAPTMEGLHVLAETVPWLDERHPREPKVKPKARAR
jgi:hypothetical protein